MIGKKDIFKSHQSINALCFSFLETPSDIGNSGGGCHMTFLTYKSLDQSSCPFIHYSHGSGEKHLIPNPKPSWPFTSSLKKKRRCTVKAMEWKIAFC